MDPFDPDEILPAREVFRRLSAVRRAARQRAEMYGPTRVYSVVERLTPRAQMISEQQERRHTREGTRLAAIFQAQGGRCYLCQCVFSAHLPTTVDHVLPRARGGRTARNILLACSPCNNAKGDRPPTARELDYLAEVNATLMGIEPAERRQAG